MENWFTKYYSLLNATWIIMNLPSIFKSAPTMKANNNVNKNDKF
jgi:hypothetical protein